MENAGLPSASHSTRAKVGGSARRSGCSRSVRAAARRETAITPTSTSFAFNDHAAATRASTVLESGSDSRRQSPLVESHGELRRDGRRRHPEHFRRIYGHVRRARARGSGTLVWWRSWCERRLGGGSAVDHASSATSRSQYRHSRRHLSRWRLSAPLL